MKRINVNVRPNDGYWYREADGTKFKGQNWAQVIKKVHEFRRINGKAIGNPTADVMNQACGRLPQLCHEQRAPQRTQTVQTLKGRVMKWLTDFARLAKTQKLGFVRQHERDQRTQVCARCPAHSFLPSKCAACLATIGAQTSAILDKQHAPDKRVESCEILGIYLPVATWLDEVTVAEPRLPDTCWRKRR